MTHQEINLRTKERLSESLKKLLKTKPFDKITVSELIRDSDVNRKGTASDLDYGDWLLAEGRVTQEEYDKKQREALELLRGVS